MLVNETPGVEFNQDVIGRVVIGKNSPGNEGKEFEVLSEADAYYTANQWFDKLERKPLIISKAIVEEFIEY